MMYDSVEGLVADFHQMGQDAYEEFRLEAMRLLSIDTSVTKEEFISQNPEEITGRIYKEMIDNYSRKVEIIAKQAWPVIKDVYEHKSHIYNNIVVPISDGQKVYQIVTNLEKSYNSEAQDLVKSYMKQVNLASIDDSWKEHLRELDDLRTSVQNASYEQKDPLLIYKLESFNLFKSMMDKLNLDVVSTLMKGHIPISDPDQVQEARAVQHTDRSQYQEQKSEAGRLSSGGGEQGGEQQPPKKMEPIRHGPKIGRNDPCPCGSGKKYKQCHGRGVV
jgi:preprotein translocase subunit SecA